MGEAIIGLLWAVFWLVAIIFGIGVVSAVVFAAWMMSMLRAEARGDL